jgi:predicted NBD/HSP70 family sugar kinase
MNAVATETGVVLGFGGTNARVGVCHEGDVQGFTSIETPEHPREFFGWMARQVLGAADMGNNWLVAGFPGPVSPDGTMAGPMANVPGLAKEQYHLARELTAADPAVGRLLQEGFTLVAVNDGELAAQAAADRIGNYGFDRTAALILGTGVGAGIVDRDHAYENVSRADRSNPTEIGHILLSGDPVDTFENAVSGPALKRVYGKDARDLPASHPAWKKVGESAGRLSTILGVMNGVELVVPCGGIGAGASDKYGPHLRSMIDTYREHGNGPQKLFLPEIIPVPQADAQIFEMFGGEGVMRDFATRAVA